jgi:L-serine deaminase
MAAAEEDDIELLFAPAGGTSEHQPLDYRIFEEFTSRAEAEITKLSATRRAVNIDYDQTVSISVRYWRAISVENICKACGLLSLARAVMSE